MKLIDKSALVAEIKRRIKVSQDYAKCNLTVSTKIGNQAQLLELNDILSFLDTLEVKEVQEPTAADRGMVEEIIINLKRVEQDYHIDLTKEMKWLRSKAQKEE